MTEFAGWMKRLVKRPIERHYARRVSQYVTQPKRQFYLLPLQLETDYQIRRHSSFKSMTDVMDLVMESFADRAPKNSLLVLKLHPLDNGLVNFRKQAKRIARRLGLRGRVFVIDGGHLPTLLSNSRGVVVVNSTTGLWRCTDRPTKALGRALFDLPGLTFQGPLDRFWKEQRGPIRSFSARSGEWFCAARRSTGVFHQGRYGAGRRRRDRANRRGAGCQHRDQRGARRDREGAALRGDAAPVAPIPVPVKLPGVPGQDHSGQAPAGRDVQGMGSRAARRASRLYG